MTNKKHTFYAQDIFIVSSIALALVFGTSYILAAFQSQFGSVALYNITNSHVCQFTTGSSLFATSMYCTLNATRAICSNNGGTHLPFITNYSYMAWPLCNATQISIVHKPNSIQVIDN